MAKRKFYKVAGHVFEVNCRGEDDVFSLMGNYRPFEISCGVDRIFCLDILADTQKIAIAETVRQIDEGQEIVCGKLADGSPAFEFYCGETKAGALVCNEDFSEGKLYFLDELENLEQIRLNHLKKFALDNALMILYALVTADKNTALFHSAVVVRGGYGYMFLGKSGTGKSTHARMWLKHFADAELLNDDNPVVRLERDGAWVYGSPWSGKTPCYKNLKFKVGGIVDLSQAPRNEIFPIHGIEAYMALVVSISGMRWNKKIADGLHETENRLAQSVNMFRLKCLPDENAAEVCFRAVSQTLNREPGNF